MDGEERVRTIVRTLRTAERVSVVDLAADTGCSEMTIRRDLDQLAAAGVLRRVRGGAISLMLRGEGQPFAVREIESSDAKRRIGTAAASLIADGEAVVLDSGTTGREVAKALTGRRLTAMPLSLHVAEVLTGEPDIRLLIPGGEVRPGELGFLGELTVASVRALRFDTIVIGCCGFSVAQGVTAYDLADVAVKQAVLESGRRVIAVADGTKFGRTSLGFVCPVGRLDIVVTDGTAPPEEIAAVRAEGVEVRVV